MPEIPAPRAILFDWDDTLVDNWAAIGDALNAAFRVMGREPWTHSQTRERVRKSLRDSFPEMFGELWEEARDVFYANFAANHLGTLEEKPGASAMLDTLGASGLFMAVISNKRGDFLRREAEHLGWDRYFSGFVGAGDAAADKPDAAPVVMALAQSGVEPGRDVWVVGDTWVDLAAARGAGCVPVLIGPCVPDTVDFETHPPEIHVESFKSLLRVVRERIVSQI
jgi:phosphoglycolate phosphatase